MKLDIKANIVLLFFLASIACNTNPKHVNSKQVISTSIRKTCDTNISCYVNSAKQDFKEGHFRFFYKGLMDANSFDDFYIRCLSENGFEIIGGGDVGDKFDEGLFEYNRAMTNFLLDSFGKNYFDKCKMDAAEKSKKDRKAFHEI